MSSGKIWQNLSLTSSSSYQAAILNFRHLVAPTAVYPAAFLMKVTVFLKGPIHTTPKEALFLTVKHTVYNNPSRNRSFRKRSSSRRSFKTPACCFSVDWKHCKKELFDNNDFTIIMFSSNTTCAKWPVIIAFLLFSFVVWTANIWCVFRMETLRWSLWISPAQRGPPRC